MTSIKGYLVKHQVNVNQIIDKNFLQLIHERYPISECIRPTYLQACALSNDVAATKLAIEMGGDLEHADHFGYTALTFACDYRAPHTVKLLLEHGAKVDHKGCYGNATPLMFTACSIHEQGAICAILLLLAGASAIKQCSTPDDCSAENFKGTHYYQGKMKGTFLNIADNFNNRLFLETVIPYLDKNRNGISADEAADAFDIDLDQALLKKIETDKKLKASKLIPEISLKSRIPHTQEKIDGFIKETYTYCAEPEKVFGFFALAMSMGCIFGFKSSFCITPLAASIVCLVALGLKKGDIVSNAVISTTEKASQALEYISVSGDQAMGKISDSIVKVSDSVTGFFGRANLNVAHDVKGTDTMARVSDSIVKASDSVTGFFGRANLNVAHDVKGSVNHNVSATHQVKHKSRCSIQ